MHGDDTARRETGRHPFLAGQYFTHIGVADDAQAGQAAVGRRHGSGVGGSGLGVGERFQGGGTARLQRHRVPGLENAARHRPALTVQSDESHAHQRTSVP